MATKQREMTESMHYESRHIRDALTASNARLRSARSGRPAADLQPQIGAAMLQEWEGLSSSGTLDQGDTLAADNPLYQQMRSALLAFESDVGYAAPARERAFFAALRTQLMEAGTQRDAAQREMHIAATHKWFSKHQPQGPQADPVTAAVLASSLAVEAVGAPTQQDTRPSTSGTPSSGQVRLSASQIPGVLGASAAAGSGSPGAQGKQFFFDVYSRAAIHRSGASISGVATTSGAAAALRPTSARGPSPSTRPVVRASDESPALLLNHPLAMYPTVSAGVGTRGGGGGGSGAAVSSATAGGLPAAPPRARFAASEMYAPGKLVRSQELDELDRAAHAAAAAAVAGFSGGAGTAQPPLHSKPWNSAPYKPGTGVAAGTLGYGNNGGAGRAVISAGAGSRTSQPGPDEEEEMRVLRAKWSAMETRTNQAVADVQSKMAEWSLQRARLEEEMVRRQEASRIAPLNGNLGGAGGAPWQIDGVRRSGFDDGFLAPGNLSPYANANADLAAATAAAASGPGALGFVMPSGGLHGAAAAAMGASMRMRHAEIGTYDRGRAELVDRLATLGLNVKTGTLDRALRPLEDRPFLDCIARLPRPGENLVSRPDSGRVPAAKKKRGKSASRKRPTSGR